MGKYGIGARVRDEDGDEGVIVAKRKGERRVKYEDGLPGFEVWLHKSFLTPIAAPIADNDDAPAPAEQGQGGFKVGDRVKCDGCFTFDPSIGTVTHNGGHYYEVELDSDPFDDGLKKWNYYPHHLTLLPATPEWQPKVGDRVRLVKHCNAYGDEIPLHLPIGAESVITEITNTLADEGVTTFLLEGGGFNFYTPLNVEPLPVAAEAQGAVEDTAGGLTIEAGKFYRTRDGRKVGPMEWWDEFGAGVEHPWEDMQEGGALYRPDGTSDYADDIVADWVDEPAALSPKFKVGDRVRYTEGVLKTGFWMRPGMTGVIAEIYGDHYHVRGVDGMVSSVWGKDDYLEPADAPVPTIPVGTLVTLAAPGMVTGHNGPNVSVVFPSGSYDLPASALVVA